MTLPTSGQLVASAINSELGRGSCSQLSIDTAENGGYSIINENSRSRPNESNPAAYSEWYGYNHRAGGPIGPDPSVLYRMGFTRRSGQSGANFACAGGDIREIYHQPAYPNQNWFASDSLIFQDPFLTVFADPGTYSDQPFEDGFSARYWDGSRMSGLGYLCEI